MEDVPPDVLLDYTQDKVVIVDAEGTFTYLNAATKEILGFDPDALVGENAFEYIHPDDVDRVRSVFEETIRSDAAYTDATVEYRHRTSDGDWVWLESRFSNLTDAELDGYVVSSRDVTDRVEAERERERTATHLREIAANTADVLWLFSGDWSRVLFVNPAYEEIYGGSVEELEGDPSGFLECIHPEDRSCVEAAMERLSAGERVDIEYRVNPDQNYNRWVWVQGQPIVEDGEVVRIAGFTRDVTDRQRREKQLAVIDTVLRHNLRNDLNKILGYASKVGDPDAAFDREEAEECVRVIRHVGQGMLDKTEKQREINRLLTTPPSRCRLELAELVDRAVAPFEDDARVDVDVPDGLAASALVETEVAIGELVCNAIEHAEQARPGISVSAVREGDEAVVEVRDENPPIPDYDHRVLTGDAEMNEVYHSSGLGLWLVYWVVDLSDGSVEYARRDGGNVIRLRLPAADA